MSHEVIDLIGLYVVLNAFFVLVFSSLRHHKTLQVHTMALPHKIQMQLIRKRLTGKEGRAKLLEIRAIMDELPGYNTGPYGEIKKWLREEIEKTRVRSTVKHQDWLGVKREGIKQFVLVGPPSAGKSSLLHTLCGLQTKIAAYEFTTLKPIPGVVRINDADFQIVDLPGLIEGAASDAGGGKRLIGLVKMADGMILMHDLSRPLARLEKILVELENANVSQKMIVLGNKIDVGRENLTELQQRFPSTTIIGTSTITGEGLDELKNALWKMSKLVRVFTSDNRPFILSEGASVKDVVVKIHKDLLRTFKHARITGPSAKFANQIVGLKHVVSDGDRVEVVCG